MMSVAKIIEISSESVQSFDEAIQQGIRKASRTVNNIEAAWIKEQKVVVDKGEISGYRVNLKVTFRLEE